MRIAGHLAAAVACGWLLALPAAGQTITGVVVAKNAGNSPDEFYADLAISYERESAVAVTAATATSLNTRYLGLASADAGVFGGPRLEVLDSDYTLAFTATAPGAYRLNVTTRRKGDLHLVEDNIFVADHFADMTALTGTAAGGTLTAGTLSLADPGRANDIPLFFDPISVPFDQSSSAVIFGVSNGAGVAHSLRFTWSQQAFSPAGGDEAAVRLGGTSDDPTETAADYPGAPARVQADDGHFVTVTLVSLCGNGVLDTGPSYAEQCDDGVLTGTPASCCAADCTIRPGGTPCRPAAGPCDVGENCTGGSGSCPADGFAPPAVVCRAVTAGEVCDVPESCTGGSASCPADALAAGGTPCRPATGACDAAEACDGSAKACPADGFVPDGTACGDGLFCNGEETCQSGSCASAGDPCVLGCDESLDQCLTGACPLAPQTCRSAEKAPLLLKDEDDDGADQLLWKWLNGAATTGAEFGDPVSGAGYALCLYTGGGATLAVEIDVPAGSAWSPLGAIGYAYTDPTGAAGGTQRIRLKGNPANKSKILFKGRGAGLPDLLDGAPADLPVTVQLLNQDNGLCWGSTFVAASPNDGSRLKARVP
jgi:hypothetical protein